MKKLDGLEIYNSEENKIEEDRFLGDDMVQKEKDENKESFIKKIWNKTVFPEKIKNYKELKKMENKIKHEARKEVLADMKEDLKDQYKEKMSPKNKKSGLDKLGKMFEDSSGMFSDEKMNKMLGNSSGGQSNNNSEGSRVGSTDHIKRMLGQTESEKKPKEKSTETHEEKIKRMLS
jgi:hypothetical protein